MRCKEFRRWMGTSDEPVPAGPARVHLDGCPACAGLFQAYGRALEVATRATDGESPTFPGDLAFRRLIADRRRQRELRETGTQRRRVALWALPLAAGLAAVALWGRAVPDHAPAPLAVAGPTDGPFLARVAGAPSAGWVPGLPRLVPVRSGQTLEAGAGVGVLFDDPTGRVRLDPGTTLRVEAWDAVATVLRLEEGRLEAEVRPRAEGQAFEIQTRLATIRVVGTRFVVAHDPVSGTVVTVAEGKVQVQSLAGDRIALLPAGGTLRIGTRGEDAWPTPEVEPAATRAAVATLPVPAAADRHRPQPHVLTGPMTTTVVAPLASQDAAAGPLDLVTRVRALFAAGRFDEALELLAGAAEQPSPQRGRLLALTGDAQLATGRVELARTAYERSLGAEWQGLPPEGVYLDLAQLLDERLHRGADAAAVWQRYLAAWPQGHYAPQALLAVAAMHRNAGRADQALRLLATLVAQWPDATQAATAVALLGRDAVDRGDLGAAAGVFEPRVASRNPVVAEVALVGLMRVRLQEGRPEEARRLEADYGRRFPSGLHRAEVEEVRHALAPDGSGAR